MNGQNGLVQWFMLAVVPAVMAGCPAGCVPNAEPIERSFNTLMIDVIGPGVEKALAELKTQTGTLQGGAEVIDPGIVVDGYAHWTGTGIIYKARAYLKGVAGRIAGFAQGSNPVGWNQGESATPPQEPGDGN